MTDSTGLFVALAPTTNDFFASGAISMTAWRFRHFHLEIFSLSRAYVMA
jgi:hypothetical protein